MDVIAFGLESPRVYMNMPPLNNLDLSISKSFPFGGPRRLEIRLDAFNALNHTQFSGVNRTLNFASLTDRTITNPVYNADGSFAIASRMPMSRLKASGACKRLRPANSASAASFSRSSESANRVSKSARRPSLATSASSAPPAA